MKALRLCLAAGLLVPVGPVAALAQTPSPAATKQATVGGPWNVVVSGESGFATFQDIQVPVNPVAGMRADGSTAQTENSTHAGLPLAAGIGLDYQPSQRWRWTVASLDAMNVQASSGPADTQSSSYTRLEVGSSIRYRLPLGDTMTGTLGALASFRRSSFANVSTSHYIDAATLGAEAGIERGPFAWTLTGRTAPYASFGYSNAALLGGSALPGSTASLNEAGTSLSYALRPKVWLDLGVDREMTHVVIPNVAAYDAFGLNVQDFANPSRVYDLATTTVRFGFHREF